jgi:Cof subfamily protein (haloacid dehalogenase superfamily)
MADSPAKSERVEGATPIRFVISDVDGTLLDDRKQVTQRAKEAIKALKAAGIGFTIVSARPPKALLPLIDELELEQPLASFNGAMICSPKLEVLSQKLMTRRSSTHSAQLIVDHGLDLWAFVGTDWYATEPLGPHTPHHREMLGPPKQMNLTLEICSAAAKLVGVTDDHVKMAACEAAVNADTTMSISVSRSSDYYLDITDRDANKGLAVDLLSAIVGIPQSQIATLGDMPTDMLMFAKSGFSIAMGQSDERVRAAATAVTASYADEGFAQAIERFLLSGQVPAAQGAR